MPLGLHPAEFVPAAPLLPALAEVMGYAVAFGVCVLALQIVRAFFGTADSVVGWIPWLGSKIKGPLHSIEQKVTNELGRAVSDLDHRMALAWYKLSHIAEWMGHEIAANAGVLADLANLLANPGSIPAWRKVIGDANHAIHTVRNSIAGKVHDVTQPMTARLARLEHRTHLWYLALHFAIAVTIPGELLNLRHRNRSLTDSITNAWKLLKKHERLLGIGAMTGVVAVVLSRLGLGWTRCNNVGRVGKNVCGMDSALLESLLADSLLIAGSLSLVEFAREMVGVTDTAVRPITTFWRAS